ncbi:MAG: hypothetical protein LC637_04385 [Xanthomonadaceae bacterium]|nr:hypothetical protein [Xanthomonadaceae bacterium]
MNATPRMAFAIATTLIGLTIAVSLAPARSDCDLFGWFLASFELARTTIELQFGSLIGIVALFIKQLSRQFAAWTH